MRMKIRIDRTREAVETGCYLAADCFRCPFVDCKADDAHLSKDRKNENRMTIFRLADGGMAQREIVRVTGLRSNTVSYYIRLWKNERNNSPMITKAIFEGE